LKKFFLSSTFDLDSEALLEAGSLKTVNQQGLNVFILSKHGENDDYNLLPIEKSEMKCCKWRAHRDEMGEY